MSKCWPEGELRAHLDRELPPADMDRVAAHLGECANCAGVSKELAARAERVGLWMNELPAPEMEWRVPQARRKTAGRQWIGLAAGLAAAVAASLALAAWLLPWHNGAVIVKAPASVSPAVPAPPAIAEAAGERPIVAAPPTHTATHTASLPRRARGPRPLTRTVSDEFLALDDEPIETGVVMRVGVEPGNVQADIVFGPDGRAHAIRLVSARN